MPSDIFIAGFADGFLAGSLAVIACWVAYLIGREGLDKTASSQGEQK